MIPGWGSCLELFCFAALNPLHSACFCYCCSKPVFYAITVLMFSSVSLFLSCFQFLLSLCLKSEYLLTIVNLMKLRWHNLRNIVSGPLFFLKEKKSQNKKQKREICLRDFFFLLLLPSCQNLKLCIEVALALILLKCNSYPPFTSNHQN